MSAETDLATNFATLRKTASTAPLSQLEEAVSENLHAVVLVAVALEAIHSRKLWKDSHSSFAAYCLDRWGISQSSAYRRLGQAKAITAGQRVPRAGKTIPSQRSLGTKSPEPKAALSLPAGTVDATSNGAQEPEGTGSFRDGPSSPAPPLTIRGAANRLLDVEPADGFAEMGRPTFDELEVWMVEARKSDPLRKPVVNRAVAPRPVTKAHRPGCSCLRCKPTPKAAAR